MLTTDWSQCEHKVQYRNGFRSGKQLWRCAFCGRYIIEGRTERRPEEIMRLLAPYFSRGESARQAMIGTGIAWATVRKYYHKFKQFRPDQKHVCGKPIMHRGACSAAGK